VGFKDEKKPTEARKPSGWPKWLRWIGDFFGWLAETSRMLFWLLIAALAVSRGIPLRLFRTRIQRAACGASWRPRTCRTWTSGPSLPDDVGAAARQLWDRGDTRAALALLYRGLLSRLACLRSSDS
jgi:hypothetical protein